MNHTKTAFQQSRRFRAAVAASLVFLSGILYYGLFRHQGLWLGDLWPALNSIRGTLHDPSNGTYPSFAHTLTFSLLGIVCFSTNKKRLLRYWLWLLLVTISLESAVGVFDVIDIIAAVTGFLPALLWVSAQSKTDIHVQTEFTITLPLLVLVSGLLALGSYEIEPGCARYDGNTCVENKQWATPVYMSYADLRRAVEVADPRDPQKIGKLYLYGQYIFIVEPNQGIHIIDNRFPFTPVRRKFLKIPGNTEVNIANNYLYADSYIDLLTFDLSNPENIQLIKREEDIFPFDAFQNIPYNIAFRYADIDSNRGVIVSYVKE